MPADEAKNRPKLQVHPTTGRPITYHRTIWLSDIHLGTKDCQADRLLDFLKHNESETLYLVGDIIDGWRLKKGWYWPQSHSTVVQKVLKKAKRGTNVIYIPGNHDAFLRDYEGMNFGNIKLQNKAMHETADGKKLLIVHGDEYDSVMKYAPWLAYIGDKMYYVTLRLNDWYNRVRARFGRPYYSLSAKIKHKVKLAVELISDFEKFLIEETRRLGADGVVCGHIHHAEVRDMDGVTYYNDGDWVESCTALVEHADGSMEIVEWTAAVDKQVEEMVDEQIEALISQLATEKMKT